MISREEHELSWKWERARFDQEWELVWKGSPEMWEVWLQTCGRVGDWTGPGDGEL
jgi:hypothetical protein